MTQLIFNEDQVLDVIGSTPLNEASLRTLMAEAARLGYCAPVETGGGAWHQFGVHPSRVWRSLLWPDTPQAVAFDHE